MYPVTRLITSGIRAWRSSCLPFDGISEIEFVCRPWDIDMFGEVNNGRQLTLYDLGRFDLAMRVGLLRVLKDNGWGLTVAGSSARYRKRIRAFNKVTMRTQAVGADDRWIYLAQSMWLGSTPASSLLVRTCVTQKGGSVPTEQVRQAVGAENWHPELPGMGDQLGHSRHQSPLAPCAVKPTPRPTASHTSSRPLYLFVIPATEPGSSGDSPCPLLLRLDP